MVIIIIEGVIVGDLWLVTAVDDLPGARVGVTLSARLSLIEFRPARRARGLRSLAWDAATRGILIVIRRGRGLLSTARYAVASSSHSSHGRFVK